MSSSELTSSQAANPLVPVEQLAHWLVTGACELAIGLTLGLAATHLLRVRHLRWTWSVVALVAIVIARPLLGGGLTLALGLAATSACARGRRWHREDLETGADMRDLADERRGPLDVIGLLVRRIEPRWTRSAAPDWFRGGRLAIGRAQDGRVVTVPLGGSAGGTHTLVVGATRSGKTVTMTWMAVQALAHGMGTVVLDPKGDRDLRGALHEAARRTGKRFLEWTPRGCTVYNPYAHGSETEIADKALAGERFTEPHYLRQAQRYLGHVVRALRKAGLEVSLRSLVQQLDPSRLELLARTLPERDVLGLHDYLDSLTPRQLSDLSGVRDRLAIMAESDIGALLDPDTPNLDRLDLRDAVNARAIVYFNLEADQRPLLAQMLGAAIVQDLQATVAALQGRPVATLVLIDEFSAIVPERVVGLFARASGAGISLVLGTQELADLRIPGRETLPEQIMGNLSVLIAHRQVVPASANLIASMTEARGAWRSSRHGDGRVTRTRIFEHALRAERVVGLPRGCAAVIGLSDGGSTSVARIFSAACPPARRVR